MAYTTIDNPELFFQTKLYTGNSGTQSITFDGSENMQPDWVWQKRRDSSGNHELTDSVRGINKTLKSNLSSAEDTGTDKLQSFDSDGFTAGSSGTNNASGGSFVAWNWKASGSTSSDSNGSITSTVSANTTTGFSIVTYTGTGSNATVGHGLGAVPQVIIVKNRDGGSDNWAVYHEELGANNWLKLNTTDASATDTVMWNNTTPTSSVFSVGTYTNSNGNTNGMLAYCLTEKQGYSKFSSFVGNGSSDGAFVYTGFRPAFVMTKRTNSTSHWLMMDNKRNTFNVADTLLVANDSDYESNWGTGRKIDFLSNGFKARSTSTGLNVSGSSYIYLAFAESPFVNSSGVPNNAR